MSTPVPSRGAACVVVLGIALVVASSATLSARALLALYAVAGLLARLLRYAVLIAVAPLAIAWLGERRQRQAARRNARGPCGETEQRTSLANRGKRIRKAVQPLCFTSPAAWSVTQTRANWEATARSGPRPLLPPTTPAGPTVFDTALDSLLHLITRDFIQNWYSSLSDSPVFPVAVESAIREVLVAVSTRTAKIDWAEVLVSRIAPLLSTHLERCRAAEKAVHGRDAGKAPPPDSDEADLLLAGKYAATTPNKKLHQAVDVASPNSRPAEEAWLRGLVESILPLVLPEHEHASPAVRIMIREIVACAVLIPVFETLCDPDFWNRLIEDKASAAIRDQRMVSQFRQALDEGATIASAGKRSFTAPGKIETAPARKRCLDVISVRTSGRQFDAWIKGINRCATVADAKRLRSDVSAQIRRAKTLTEGRKNDELVEGIPVTQWIDFIERLYTAKRKIDKRISKLGGASAGLARAPSIYSLAAAETTISFRDILLDPSAVTYVMEYLERRKHASRATFWLAVEGTKDPLDDIVDDDLVVTTSKAAELQTQAFLDDVKMIWEAYLATDPFHSNPTHLQTIEAFATATDPTTSEITPADLRTLRHALFAVQHGVLALLQDEDLPGFVRSDLYFKALSTLSPALNAPHATTASVEGPLLPVPTSPRAIPPIVARATRSPPALPARPEGVRLDSTRVLVTAETLTAVEPSKAESRRSPSPSPSPVMARTELIAVRESAPPELSRAHAVVGEQAPLIDGENSPPLPGPPRAGRAQALSRIDEGGDDEAQNSLSFLIGAPSKDADDATRPPLFEGAEVDDVDLDDEDFVEIRTIDAIQDALSSILESADAQSARSLQSSVVSLPDGAGAPIGRRLSGEHARSKSASALTTLASAAGSTSSGSPRLPLSPTLPSAGLPALSGARGRRVFDDPETYADPDDSAPTSETPYAASGMTCASLPELEERTRTLHEQGIVVNALIRRAELTGNLAELKLLCKSRDMLEGELRAIAYRQAQLDSEMEKHKTAFSIHRTQLSIPDTSVGQVSGLGSQSFQLFLVRVQQQSGDASSVEWIVPRRYSEFASMNDRLREQHPATRALDFPTKRLVGTWSKDFIEHRRLGLERYLQALLLLPEVSSDAHFCDFLSRQSIAVPPSDSRKKRAGGVATPALRNLYRGFTSGIDDVLGTSTTSLLDTVVERLTAQASDLADPANLGLKVEDLAGGFPAGAAAGSARGEGFSSFTAPICDLFLTAFDLREDWVRRQAILIVLQQVLGGAIERKLRDAVSNLLSPFQLAGYIDALRGSLWPNDQKRPPSEQRSQEQRHRSRDAAISCLATLMPEFAANLIGRHNAKWGARRLFAAVQSKRLNKHLVYSIADEAIHLVFPEL